MDDWSRLWQPVLGPLMAAVRPEGIEASLRWAEGFRQATQHYLDSLTPSAAGASSAAEALAEFLRQAQRAPQTWTPAVAALDSDWPALGPGREHQQRWQRLQQAAARAAAAQQRLQQLWAQGLQRAADRFVQQLPTSASQAADVKPEALYARWIDCAEAQHAELAHSEAYADAQADWVNAGSAYRHEARAWVEQWCQWLDLPTRSELSTLELRVKALERQLQGLASARSGS